MHWHLPARQLTLFALGVCLLATTAAQATQPVELQRLRQARREAMRSNNLTATKDAAPLRFGLLVIPVDFADARLPEDWDIQSLAPRLFPDSGESLHNYFSVASRGRLDLKITVAPAVHLPETRRQYSDRDLNGFTRTRSLATESITAVRDLGLEFRRLDDDGPDGVAGTADDDGAVDGVLILHAGIGNENDPQEGLIQALQFFLEEPVMSQGVAASFYAVASLYSGPGIWAHETAHLLGMEDRYDPLLHPVDSSEVVSLGGLGRFSLMSSGAWGTGGGYGAALPDGYSALQLGWVSVHNLAGTGDGLDSLQPGTAARVWTQGSVGPEFFLLEARDPAANAPFDANIPGGQLLVYHIDENLPEGSWHQDGQQLYHLRARLVEADADRKLASGDDDGSVSDLFPGSLGITDFGPSTVPSSSGYYSGPSRIALREITPAAGAVSFGVSVDTEPSLTFSYSFGRDAARLALVMTARETGEPLPGLTCRLQAISLDEAGVFASTGSRTVTFELAEQTPGVWIPVTAVNWLPAPNVPADVVTRFEFQLSHNGVSFARETRDWVWQSTGDDLNFKAGWPGKWVIEHPTGDTATTWHRWHTAPWLTADQTAVLACTGSEYVTADSWPAVTYANRAHTTLTSAPLDAGIAGVRLTHGIEVEMLDDVTGMDGGVVSWLGPDGETQPAVPVDGYPGQIANKSGNPLHGRAAFVGREIEPTSNQITWRTDTFLVPVTGPGPWRLRLDFASNSLWRARGWFIADIEPIAAGTVAVGFSPDWDGDLVWDWPWPETAAVPFAVQTRPDASTPWTLVLSEDLLAEGDGHYRIDGVRLLSSFAGGARQRNQVRVVGHRPVGDLASHSIVVYPDGGDGRSEIFSVPWPNPALGEVRFLLDIPAGSSATLRIFNVAGRLLFNRKYGAGQQLVVWDGLTEAGRRVAAGDYFLQLDGAGSVVTRKVVLLH